MKNRIFTSLLCVFTVLLIITFSIALPIFIRPFYYFHIEKYNITQTTGMSKTQIKDGYDEVLDYLTIPGKEFSTGDFKYSQEGKAHFEDCKVLFSINSLVLVISAVAIVLLIFLKRKKFFTPVRPFSLHHAFISGTSLLGLFAVIGGLAALDFDNAFLIFHKLFFYGKDNWLFDSSKDEIITALPTEFFFNCAVLILSSVVFLSIILILFSVFEKKYKK